MDIKEQRRIHTRCGKKLKRARYLFVFLCRNRLLAYDDAYMELFVKKCREYGLYSDGSDDRSIRFFVLRRLYKIHNPDNISWYEWYAHYHWRPFQWTKTY